MCVCVCAHAKSLRWLCDLVKCSPPGSSVHAIFLGKNTGVGCHFLLQGNLPDPGIKPMSPVSPELIADSLPCPTWEAPICVSYSYIIQIYITDLYINLDMRNSALFFMWQRCIYHFKRGTHFAFSCETLNQVAESDYVATGLPLSKEGSSDRLICHVFWVSAHREQVS